jgi:hypothetical protein
MGRVDSGKCCSAAWWDSVAAFVVKPIARPKMLAKRSLDAAFLAMENIIGGSWIAKVLKKNVKRLDDVDDVHRVLLII